MPNVTQSQKTGPRQRPAKYGRNQKKKKSPGAQSENPRRPAKQPNATHENSPKTH
jgi:hypothetical protein